MSVEYKGHPVIVFALEHYNPLGLIRSLGENGIEPIYICVLAKGKHKSACLSKYISKLHIVDTVEAGYRLLFAEYSGQTRENLPLVLFSDDKSIGYFDARYDEVKDHFIVFNAQKANGIFKYMDKAEILHLAEKHGFRTLPHWTVDRGFIPEDIEYPVITKDINSNSGAWKADVFICENEEELKVAYTKITSPVVLLQKYIDKKNECALQGYAVNHGLDMHIVTAMSWKYLIKGYYSPYHDVFMYEDVESISKLAAMFKEIGFEGIFEVEFMIDKDDVHYFSEINFRASAWNYTGSCADMPISYLWVKGMIDGKIDSKDIKEFEPFTSMSEVIDFGKRVDTGKVSVAEWAKDFKEAKCTYFYNKDDMAPFEMLFEEWENFK